MAEPLAPIKTILLQPIETARHYSARKLRADGLAGLTVAVVGIPQAMAFALIAGVPPIVGLYGLMVQLFIGSLLTSVPRLSIGPTNTLSLLTAAIVTRMSPEADTATYLQLVVALALLTGVMQMCFAAARLGSLVRYVSHSVVVGFTAGAGLLIAAKQVPNILGLADKAPVADKWPGLVGIVQEFAPVVDAYNWRALLIGLMVVMVALICRRISRLLPGPFIAVALAAAVVYFAGWSGGEDATAALPMVGELPTAEILPKFRWVSIPWELGGDLLGGALAVALLGLLEGVAIARSLTGRSGGSVNANQEFLTQGVTNFVSSFLQCYPGTASFSRSALNDMAGATTRFAGVMTAVMVLVILWVASPLARYIPLAALAGILMVVAYSLVDWRHLLRLWGVDRSDAWVCTATLLATLFIHLEYAVFVGIFLNIALYLRRASRLHIAEMVRMPGGPFQERPIRTRTGQQAVVFLQLEGDLFFGVADELAEHLNALAHSPARVVVMRLKRTLSIDSTVLHALDQFARNMHERDKYLLLCGVRQELMASLERYGVVDSIGRENVFPTTFGVFTSAKQALRRAQQLLKHSLDTTDLPDDLEDDQGWAYEI